MTGPDWTRRGEVIVRPFGYRHDDPVVRRIGDRDLFLGNAHAAAPERHDHTFDAVVSLTRERQPATTHHRPLVDGPDNDYRAFAAAADAAVELAGERSLLVHCSHGISRSSAVLAAALAVVEDRQFRDALRAVRAARPPATVHPTLFEQGLVYAAARPGG